MDCGSWRGVNRRHVVGVTFEGHCGCLFDHAKGLMTVACRAFFFFQMQSHSVRWGRINLHQPHDRHNHSPNINIPTHLTDILYDLRLLFPLPLLQTTTFTARDMFDPPSADGRCIILAPDCLPKYDSAMVGCCHQSLSNFA